jgi:hypothetical protein
MALNKTTSINKVEFSGKWKTLQVRHLVEVKDGEEIIAQSYSRDSYQPGETLPEELQPYATGVWTDELISEYNAWLESQKPPAEEEPTE